MTVATVAKTAKQTIAEAQARRVASTRRAVGLCTRDVFGDFNSRRGCNLRFGHRGSCE